MTTISAANSNLDGSGTTYDVITGAANGTLVKTIIIKSQVSTTAQGMVRLFLLNGSDDSVNLIREVPVPIITKSSRDCSFYRVIPLNYSLAAGDKILASTQNANAFNVIAEGLDWDYDPAVGDHSTLYTGNTTGEKISTANSNLDGTGTLVQIFQAGAAAAGYLGCEIKSIIIKAQQTVTPGMVRLFLNDGTKDDPKFLFCEVVIPALTQAGNIPAFAFQVINQGSLAIQAGYAIYASTQNAEAFSVTIEGLDWVYP